MAQVEVGFRAVVGDEHLAVLKRVHGAGVDVDVGVELLDGDGQAPGLEQSAQRGCGQSFAEGGKHAAGDENILGFHAGPRGIEVGRRSGRRAQKDNFFPCHERRQKAPH